VRKIALFCNFQVERFAQAVAPAGAFHPRSSTSLTGNALSRWHSSWRTFNDSDISVVEALKHGGVAVQVLRLDAEQIIAENIVEKLGRADTFVVRESSATVRVNRVILLGICLGMQLAIVEFARNLVGFADPNPIEYDTKINYPVIDVLGALRRRRTCVISRMEVAHRRSTRRKGSARNKDIGSR
jgi:CTP synthase (UTP-ammonia lyase)